MIHQDLKKASILIVDDQQSNIDILVNFLELQGLSNIRTITDPRKVIEEVNRFNPDIILLDLMMPYLSGYELLELLKTSIPSETYLPILVLTADISNSAKQKALTAGAKDFVTKPFDLVEVGLRINNLLETRFLYQQVKNRNEILEEKVQERTIELTKMNQDLLVAKDKAEASDRLKSAFLQNISHEVRTPLNGILGFGNLIAEPNITDEDKRLFLDTLQSSSDRLLKTITDYMDISLLVSGNTEVKTNEIYLAFILNNVYQNFSKACAEKQLTMNLIIPSELEDVAIVSDAVLLQKAISHLVDNAIKFTEVGFVNIGIKEELNEIIIYIEDTGIGIDEQVNEKIFGSFMQENDSSARDHEGSGLGLTIAKKSLELLNSKLWFRSKKGEGSMFYLSLAKPNNEKKQSTQNSSLQNSKYHDQRKPIKILIVEDDETSEMLLIYALKKINAEVIVSRSGTEAVEICKNNMDLDLILMDLKLTGINGFVATQEIRKFNKSVVIFAQSAFATSDYQETALIAGCNEFLAKPISESLLQAFIKKHLNKS